MIPTSRLALALVSALSIGAHAAAAVLWLSTQSATVEGGAEVLQPARMGNSFADLSAGTLVPEVSPLNAAKTAEAPLSLDTAAPKPAASETDTALALLPAAPRTVTGTELPPQALVASATTPATDTSAEALAEAVPTAATPSQATTVAQAAPVPVASLRVAALQADLAPSPPPATAQRPRASSAPSSAAQPVQPAAAPPVQTATAAQARSDARTVVRLQTSPRPRARPERPRRVAQTPPPSQSGNATRNATAGSATGTTQARATQQASRVAKATAPGNAAASTYPGLVNRKISRVRAPRVGTSASAVVRFVIDGNGGLSALSLVQSSGSDRLDAAALSIIRRAAPFPKPPPGAQRTFRKTIKGRG